MGDLFLIADGSEVARRRGLLPAGRFVEAWPDLYRPGAVWIGADARAALEEVGGALSPALVVAGATVAVFYGPRLADLDSLPAEESLRGRVLSAHGIAAAWITLDQFGAPATPQAHSPHDPVFFLRRPGGGVAHCWRLFRTRAEARVFMRELYAADPEAQAWAAGLVPADWEDLVRRQHAREGDRPV